MEEKHILVVEDNTVHRRLIVRAFESSPEAVQLTAVSTLQEAHAFLKEETPDLLIIDVRLPDGNGNTLLPDEESLYPVIIMTSYGDEQTAVNAIKAGAMDYVVKTETTLAEIPLVAQRVLREWDNIVKRREAEAALKQQSELLQTIFDHIPVMIAFTDEKNRLKLVNREWERVLGWTLSDLQAMEDIITNLFPDEDTRQKARTLLRASEPEQQMLTTCTRNGRFIETRWSSVLLSDGTRISIGQDITRQQLTEKEIQHQERLAAIGRLAAGIAHDFNNILSSVTLYIDLMLRQPNTTERTERYLHVMSNQAKRATDLIQQILDFSRRSSLEKVNINLRQVIIELIALLERTLPENIEISLNYDQNNYTIYADPTRIHQLFLNLAFNARDAMPAGGTLTFCLEKHTLQPDDVPPFPQMETGDWVKAAVIDTGQGIPAAIRNHIFEPFFTTKEPGQGPGLGLAQVYGIVRQHGGFIGVESEAGAGSTFTVYLPLVVTPIELRPASDLETLPAGQGEQILLVEDNATTREAVVESLKRLNYQVTTAVHGQDALAKLAAGKNTFALIISDLIMPEVGGRELLQTIQRRGLQIPVVIMSGYTPAVSLDTLRQEGMAAWLPKPPSMAQLAQTIHAALRKDKN